MTFAYDQATTGENLRRLLKDSRRWVNRRVDSLRLDADGTTRRYVSLDLTVPKDLVCGGAYQQMLVPLGVLEKGTKQRFDASHDGKAIPVLGRKDNSAIVAQMLKASQPSILSSAPGEDATGDDLFIKIAACDPVDSESIWTEYVTWSEGILSGCDLSPKQQDDLEAFDSLVDQMTRNFVLLVEVDDQLAGRRVVMKYALDQDEPMTNDPGTSRLVIAQAVPDLGFAASHHVELEVPAGLSVRDLKLVELRGAGDNQKDRFASKASTGRVAHVSIDPSTPDAIGILRAEVAVAKQGVFSFTIVTVWALLAASLTASFIRLFDDFFIRGEPEIPSPAASILLVGPALLISWMSRTPEHPMLARMLRPLRHMLTIAAFSLVVMAGLAAVKVQPWIWEYAWGLLLVLALVNVTWLIIFCMNVQLPTKRKFEFGVAYENEEDLEGH
ncbi:hypothetical protein [Arthrobacter sp. OV608]|uniref:hypothetical protein n=1 Tax=Arthrobacter sp. OV608 TaxID=1882768 RepID=UPI0008C04F90|nr:hypothetical protein [Arthrobacter sp. OV608]SEQ78828.1 hypothetical protein SAMN05444745_1115 [Arthrobacter sp. OV608]